MSSIDSLISRASCSAQVHIEKLMEERKQKRQRRDGDEDDA